MSTQHLQVALRCCATCKHGSSTKAARLCYPWMMCHDGIPHVVNMLWACQNYERQNPHDAKAAACKGGRVPLEGDDGRSPPGGYDQDQRAGREA